jgi:hypothetical protein
LPRPVFERTDKAFFILKSGQGGDLLDGSFAPLQLCNRYIASNGIFELL